MAMACAGGSSEVLGVGVGSGFGQRIFWESW